MKNTKGVFHPMKIPLFDIDWTLIGKDNIRNIHDEAFTIAFDKVYGLKLDQKVFQEGWIDNQIIIETVKKHGKSDEEAKAKLPEAIKLMAEYFTTHKSEVIFTPLPGIKKLLEILKEKQTIIGLLTGNVEEIGWGKVEEAGIKDFFEFGAFGNQAYKRVDLIYIAREKAERILGRSVDKNELVIIGDTPRDVACAKEGGIKSIGISSGPDPIEELVESKPDLLVKSAEEKDKIIEFLSH